MKRLVLKTLVFVSSLILLFGLLLLLPVTPRASKSLLFSSIKKDSLLANTASPRIIFVGGSNLSFGLNCQEIKDSLHINPINTAIHGGVGMKYALENTMQYVKQGDIIVFVPEYLFFYKDWNWCSEELFRIVFDCNKKNLKLLSFGQLYKCFPYTGKFIRSKFNKNEYVGWEESDLYSVNSFNEYGDANAHWNLENQDIIIPKETIDITEYNPKVIENIKQIFNELQKKDCILLISYPCFQETAFNNSKEIVKKVEKEYCVNGFTVLGSPERYVMPDTLMFNGWYHANRQGVERRTKLLIEDLKNALKINQ